MSELFCIGDLLELGRKNIFKKSYGFQPPANQNEVK